MKCLNAGDREKLLDLIVEAGLVEITYARVEQATVDKPGAIYCTIQQRKRTSDGHPSRTTDPPGTAPCDPSELFAE